MSLFSEFMSNRGKKMRKLMHYFPIYDKHFSPWKNRSLVFLEIGVQRGGSLQMWQKYFGPYTKIIGIDIKPKCKKLEQPGIFIRIGDQSDTEFLQKLIDEFGVPDVVLDDGSHHMEHVNATFDFLYPKMGKNAVYMVEDMQVAYREEYGGGVDAEASFINRCKGFVDQLNANNSQGVVSETDITRSTLGISFYDGIVVLEKGDIFLKDLVKTGGLSNKIEVQQY